MAEIKDLIKGQIFSPDFDVQKQYAKYAGILKGAQKGKVKTRFPPQPSGYLHIGHVKAALLNYHYCKMYSGEMILRFDDTNPSKQKHQFVQAIFQDLKTLGVKYTQVSYTSDYFQQIYGYAKQLIKKGLAYVDNTDVQTMRKQRSAKQPSQCRNLSIQQNQKIFQKMLKGQADQYCLRGKIDYASDNGALRDPVFGRTNKTPHPRTGKKYTFYPTYDFACPIVDHIQGVTHAMRTNEYADRIPQYFWVLNALNFPKHQIFQYSRLNLEYTCLSKRKLQWFVDTKRVEGWDDPRFPTVRGVLRKGIRVQTLIQFMLEQGPSVRSNLMQWQKLWAINKRIIDPICPRYSAVMFDKASKLIIDNGPTTPQAVTVDLNKLNKPLGKRPLWKTNTILVDFVDADKLIKIGQKVTLMNWGNFIIKTKQLQPNGSYLIHCDYLPDDKNFKDTAKITWLAEGSNLLIAQLVEYDHLIKVKKVQQNTNIEDVVNTNSRLSANYYIDSHIRTLNAGQFLQFQRKGYYKIDKVIMKDDDLKYTIIYTPDGKKVGLASQGGLISQKSEIKKETLEDKKVNKANKKKAEQQEKGGKKHETETKQVSDPPKKIEEPPKESETKQVSEQPKKCQESIKQSETKQVTNVTEKSQETQKPNVSQQ